MVTKEDTTKIRMKWNTCATDPVQYKPFGNVYSPQEVMIEIDLPTKFIREVCSDGTIVLSPAGMAYASREIALAIKQIYSE
jgi:hypothetical protein